MSPLSPDVPNAPGRDPAEPLHWPRRAFLTGSGAVLAAVGITHGVDRMTSPEAERPETLPGRHASTVVPGSKADQAPTLQREIDALSAAGGGEILLPRGVIALSSLTLRHLVSLRGAGRQVTVLRQEHPTHRAGAITLDAGPVFADLSDMEINGTGVAGVHGLYLQAAGNGGNPDNGGWWWSRMDDVLVRGFAGDQIWLRGGGSDSLKPHQFLTFQDVQAYATGDRAALRITGQVGQVSLIGNCIFDAAEPGSPGANIVITQEVDDDLSPRSDKAPYALRFVGATCQSNAVGILTRRVAGLSWRDGYMENVGQALDLDQNSRLVTVTGSLFANCGSAGGGGFLVRSRNSSQVLAEANLVGGREPDVDFVAESGGQIKTAGNLLDGSRALKTSGLTEQMSITAEGSLAVGSRGTVLVNTSLTPLTTLLGSHGPGESISLRAWQGPVLVAAGGNIDLAGRTSPVAVATEAVVTLARFDLSGTWVLQSVSA